MPRESARVEDVALRPLTVLADYGPVRRRIGPGGAHSLWSRLWWRQHLNAALSAVFWLMFLTVVPILKGLIPKA